MGILFISQSSENNAEAISIRDWLLDKGWSRIFLDIDPDHGLAPGQRWREELRKASDNCEAVLLLLSPEWVASKWCFAEFLIATQLGKQIFPIIVRSIEPGGVPAEISSEFQIIDLSRGDKSTALTRLEIGLQRAGIGPTNFKWPPANEPKRLPYRGLEVYEKVDAAVYFGRDELIASTISAIRLIRSGQMSSRVLVILGASGSGKSSFLRAGILSRLGRLDGEFRVLGGVRPESDPLEGENGLNACLAAMNDEPSSGRTTVVPIDQLEELFQSDEETVKEFWQRISEALASDARLLVICTIRSDSFVLLQGLESFSEIRKTLIDLPLIPQHLWPEVIRRPAGVAGQTSMFSDGIIDRIISDHKDAKALPLLSYSLKLFFIAATNPDTGSEYEPGKGIHGIIDKQIHRALTALGHSRWDDEAKIDDAVAKMFIPGLVTTDPISGQPRRRICRRRDIPDRYDDIVLALVRERLLISSAAKGEATIEVAHEALFEAWSPLRRAIGRSVADLHFAKQFVADVDDWRADSFNDRHLTYRGPSLERIVGLLGKFPTLAGGSLNLCAAYLWFCVRKDFSTAKRAKYFLLVVWLFAAFVSLRIR